MAFYLQNSYGEFINEERAQKGNMHEPHEAENRFTTNSTERA
jgi:hypothetical protein